MDLLIAQFARLQFIIQALNIEFDNHKSLHKLLGDVTNELDRRHRDFKDRMVFITTTIMTVGK